jgi:hypothetical protein
MPQLIRYSACKSNRVITDNMEKSFVINGYDNILQNRVIGYGSSKASTIFVKTNNPEHPSLARRNIELGSIDNWSRMK